MHAGVVLQHYLVAMANTGSVSMLDMSLYLRMHADAKTLVGHIFDDAGASSLEFFESIVYKSPDPENVILTIFHSKKLCKHLLKFGPALISNFRVVKTFEGHGWQHNGKFDAYKDCLGLHAMVLVGYRITKTKEIRFLIQNWWHSKAYVEMDSSYLLSSKCAITFLKEKQTIMSDLPFNAIDVVVECGEGMDAPEIPTPEFHI